MELLAATSSSWDPWSMWWLWVFLYLLWAGGLSLIFRKAGQPAWMAYIPIINAYGTLKVAGRPGWWLLLYLIPFVNVIVAVVVFYDVAKAFGRGLGMTLGLIFLNLIFVWVLGLNGDTYRGTRPGTA